MSGKVDLQVPSSVMVNTQAKVTAAITGGRAGSIVTVEIVQKRGMTPIAETQHATARMSSSGTGSVSFDLVFLARGRATLIASAYDKANTFFDPDAETVDVQ